MAIANKQAYAWRRATTGPSTYLHRWWEIKVLGNISPRGYTGSEAEEYKQSRHNNSLAYSPDKAWDGLVRCTISSKSKLELERMDTHCTKKTPSPIHTSAHPTPLLQPRGHFHEICRRQLYPNSHPALLSFYHSPPTKKQWRFAAATAKNIEIPIIRWHSLTTTLTQPSYRSITHRRLKSNGGLQLQWRKHRNSHHPTTFTDHSNHSRLKTNTNKKLYVKWQLHVNHVTFWISMINIHLLILLHRYVGNLRPKRMLIII